MARFFSKIRSQDAFSVRQQLESRYASARMNIFIVVAFTLINVVLALFDGETYFLFSAFIPYFVVGVGMMMCGKYPPEFYEDGLGDIEIVDDSFLYVMAAIAFSMILLYLVCAIFCRKHKVGMMILALVLFSLDTLAMFALAGISIDILIDVLFHAWVIFSLASGIHAHFKLKSLPEEEPKAQDPNAEFAYGESFSSDGSADNSQNGGETVDSVPKRYADTEVKSKILLEAEFEGHKICYRRVKSVNELIVDGRVYDEFEALIEPPHVLSATIDGHLIEAGLTPASQSFIDIDGNRVAKKIRLV